jgi:hypothetical protein
MTSAERPYIHQPVFVRVSITFRQMTRNPFIRWIASIHEAKGGRNPENKDASGKAVIGSVAASTRLFLRASQDRLAHCN